MDASFGLLRRAWLAVGGGVVLGAMSFVSWEVRTVPAVVAGEAVSGPASVEQTNGVRSDCAEGHGWDIVQETPSGEYQASGRETFRLLN